MESIISMAKSEYACRKIFSYLTNGIFENIEVVDDDFFIINGYSENEKVTLSIFKNGRVCWWIGRKSIEYPNDPFALVDFIRWLGYSPEPFTMRLTVSGREVIIIGKHKEYILGEIRDFISFPTCCAWDQDGKFLTPEIGLTEKQIRSFDLIKI